MISSEVCDVPGIETHNAWIEWLAKERYAKIRNGQLLSLVPKKINPELIHLKIILALWFVMIYHLGLWKGRAIAKGIIDKVSSKLIPN